MKLEVGKLYKLNCGRILFLDENCTRSESCISVGSILFLLDFDHMDEPYAFYISFKILTEDGIVGWITASTPDTDTDTVFVAIS